MFGELFGDCGCGLDGGATLGPRGRNRSGLLGDGVEDFQRVVGTLVDAEGKVVGSVGQTKEQAISGVVTKSVLAVGAVIIGGIVVAKLL